MSPMWPAISSCGTSCAPGARARPRKWRRAGREPPASYRTERDDSMKQTLFIGEYSSRNVGDGIIRMAIEKLCSQHGLPAAFRDFYGGTPDTGPGHPQPANADAVQAGPKPRPLLRKVQAALLRIELVNYAIALLFYFTRYRSIAAGYQVQRYQQVVIGGGNLLMDNFLNFPDRQ